MAELSPEARRLVGLARRGDDPTESDRSRLESRTVQRMTVALSVGSTAIGTAKLATGATLVSTMFAKGVAVGVLMVTTGVGVWQAGAYVIPSRRPVAAMAGQRFEPSRSSVNSALASTPGGGGEQRSVPTEPGPPTPRDESAAVQPSEHRPATATGRDGSRTAKTHGQPATTGTSRVEIRANPSVTTASSESEAEPPQSAAEPLQLEALALREAQKALNSGQASRALALVAEQEQRFRGGALEQERAATKIIAFCGLGRSEEARSQRANFVRRWPRSPLLSRVRNACGNETP